MDESKALRIVSALADGVNPVTGEVFPADSPYQAADIVRALFLVKNLLETRPKTAARAAPGNAGKPWSTDEDQKLLLEFDRGIGIPALAQAHGRTTAGIQARLEKHGRLEAAAIAAQGSNRHMNRGRRVTTEGL